MPATCTAAASNAPSVYFSVISLIVNALRKLSRAMKNRRQARMLAGMDDRMLADIGLTRSDLRDAYSEPLWRDPTDVLAGRAREKRVPRRRALETRYVNAPAIAPDAAFVQPPTNRPARHAM